MTMSKQRDDRLILRGDMKVVKDNELLATTIPLTIKISEHAYQALEDLRAFYTERGNATGWTPAAMEARLWNTAIALLRLDQLSALYRFTRTKAVRNERVKWENTLHRKIQHLYPKL
jgi:hypothetical protein